MLGISAYVDIEATMALARGKKPNHQDGAQIPETDMSSEWDGIPICTPCELGSKTSRRLMTIIAGSIRARHRMKHTGRVDSEKCPHPGCNADKCDTEHLFWQCTAFDHIRKIYTKYFHKSESF